MVRYSGAIITNNVIRDNGDSDINSWRNWGLCLEGIHAPDQVPTITNNVIYDNGYHEVSVEWGDPGLEINMRNNDWGTDATTEMEAGTNPQNISIFNDWYDDNLSLIHI